MFLSIIYCLSPGLIYTALLILKPTTTCSKQLKNEESIAALKTVETVSESLIRSDDEERSVTTSGLLCTAASQPLLTSLAVVWIPIIVFTVITGQINDLTKGWQNLNPPSHPNATLAPQARVNGENLNHSLSC